MPHEPSRDPGGLGDRLDRAFEPPSASPASAEAPSLIDPPAAGPFLDAVRSRRRSRRLRQGGAVAAVLVLGAVLMPSLMPSTQPPAPVPGISSGTDLALLRAIPRYRPPAARIQGLGLHVRDRSVAAEWFEQAAR